MVKKGIFAAALVLGFVTSFHFGKAVPRVAITAPAKATESKGVRCDCGGDFWCCWREPSCNGCE